MRYMVLIYNCDRPEPGDPGFAEALAKVNAFAQECRRRNAFVAGDPLQGEDTATTVRVRDGKTLTTDGPYAETREQLAGYYLVEATDLDTALTIAARIPEARKGSIEVRPVMIYD